MTQEEAMVMSKEQVIETLKDMYNTPFGDDLWFAYNEYYGALDAAIKTLENQEGYDSYLYGFAKGRRSALYQVRRIVLMSDMPKKYQKKLFEEIDSCTFGGSSIKEEDEVGDVVI